MPYRRLPNTVTAVIRQLSTAREAWGLYPAARARSRRPPRHRPPLGVSYVYDPTETPDPGDTNAANTTLAGPTTPPPQG